MIAGASGGDRRRRSDSCRARRSRRRGRRTRGGPTAAGRTGRGRHREVSTKPAASSAAPRSRRRQPRRRPPACRRRPAAGSAAGTAAADAGTRAGRRPTVPAIPVTPIEEPPPHRDAVPIPPAPPPAPAPAPAAPRATAAPRPAAPPAAPLRAAIREVLTRYKLALEARSIEALKRIWPSTRRCAASAIRDEFEHATPHRRRHCRPAHQRRRRHGDRHSFFATTRCRRRIARRAAPTTPATMTLRRTDSGWVIDTHSDSMPRGDTPAIVRCSMMSRVVTAVVLCLSVATAAAAQTQPTRLATLFEDIYGPNGLVLSSDDVQLDGTNHAAHFNSAFQSEFRLVNIALTSQLASIPLPSPALGLHLQVRSGAAARSCARRAASARSWPNAARRSAAAASPFNFAYQFFSFDHLDGVPLIEIPAVFTARQLASSAADATDVVGDDEHDRRVGQPVQRRGDLRRDRSHRRLARRCRSCARGCRCCRTPRSTGSAPARTVRPLLRRPHGDRRPRIVEAVLRRRLGERTRRHGGAREGDAAARETRARSRLASMSGCRPETSRICSGAGAAGVRPFAAFSASFGAFAPHANVGYQWNGKSVLAGDVYADVKGDLPDQFIYALGSDLSVNHHFSVVFDLLGQRVIDSPRLQVATFTATGPTAASRCPTFSSLRRRTGRTAQPSASRRTSRRACCSTSTCGSASGRTASSTASRR